jgi:hypothetical protein
MGKKYLPEGSAPKGEKIKPVNNIITTPLSRGENEKSLDPAPDRRSWIVFLTV